MGPCPAPGLRHDLGYDGSLIAVTASSNRSKSDQDPAEWLPPRREAWCSFATDWVTVKVRWGLTADQAEVAAIRRALDTCSGSSGPAPATTTTTSPSPPPSGVSGVTITALDCDGERVTVVNGGSGAVDLTSWTIHDDGTKHTYTFPAGATLAPGATTRVRSGPGAGSTGAGEYS